MTKPSPGNLFSAESTAETRAGYDAWANKYEADLLAMGYRLPWVFAATVARFVAPGDGPVLDAGCGGGMQAEPLRLLGYSGMTGADLSQEMMKVAGAKQLYDDLVQVTLGEPLSFETGRFAVTLSCGVITPGHAPADTFDELVRVTRPGGKLIYSLRDDPEQLCEYPEKIAAMEASGAWRELFRTPAFHSMPLGEPEVMHRVHVCEVLI